MMGDGAHAADMQVFHQLFDHRTEITRRVLKREDGIETVTESTNPDVTRLLQTHVASMLARCRNNDRFISAIRCSQNCFATRIGLKRHTR
jgi:hypothetical protein